jgi:hypothetical protein
MSLAAPKITCLFFTDPSVPAFLNAPAGRALAGDLLIECGTHPTLGYVLNLETPANYPGVAGLLGGVDVGSLAHPTESLPAPILLASGAPVSPFAVRAGIGRLVAPDERLTAITLLVPVSAARSLGAALAVADRFAIAWDATAFPHEELIDFARWLTTEKLVTKENFAGLHAYSTVPTTPAHTQRLAGILAPLGARLVPISG